MAPTFKISPSNGSKLSRCGPGTATAHHSEISSHEHWKGNECDKFNFKHGEFKTATKGATNGNVLKAAGNTRIPFGSAENLGLEAIHVEVLARDMGNAGLSGFGARRKSRVLRTEPEGIAQIRRQEVEKQSTKGVGVGDGD